jgi:NitT/TauT family transport system substrate-binding protein
MNRRGFLNGASLATGGLFGVRPSRPNAAEPPPETTKLRVALTPAICFAPQYVAGDGLLQSEGFTSIEYVKAPTGIGALIAGEADIAGTDVPSIVTQTDKGQPIVGLAGMHVGCYELFGTGRVRTVLDLKGKKVAYPALLSGRYLMMATILTHVGLDPRRDVEWVTSPPAESMQLLAEGKVDAYMGFPPEPQELRAKKIGHVVVSTTTDRPWSQYFCCMVAANRDFVQKNPVATKRALRAILKAIDLCALEPEHISKSLVEKRITLREDYALATLRELPYARWREYDPEDAIRFYSLRLHEAGMIRSSPQRIISQGTDWRFVNEFKKELKG